MRTDDFGREVSLAKPTKSNPLRCGRLFTIGVAVGAGLCLGMGPPLPLLDKAFSAAAATGGPGASSQPVLPRQWLVLRGALLDSGIGDVSLAQQRADETMMRGKWLALQDALESSWLERVAAR